MLFLSLAFTASLVAADSSLLPGRTFASDLSDLGSWGGYIVSSVFLYLAPVIIFLISGLVMMIICIVYSKKLKGGKFELSITRHSDKKYNRCFGCFIASLLIVFFISVALVVLLIVSLFLMYTAIENSVEVGTVISSNATLAAHYGVDASFFGSLETSALVAMVVVLVTITLAAVLGVLVIGCSFIALLQKASVVMDQCQRCPACLVAAFSIATSVLLGSWMTLNDMCASDTQIIDLAAQKTLTSGRDFNATSNSFYKAGLVILDYCVTPTGDIAGHSGCRTMTEAFETDVCVQTVACLLVAFGATTFLSIFYCIYCCTLCCVARMLTKPEKRLREAEERKKKNADARQKTMARTRAEKRLLDDDETDAEHLGRTASMHTLGKNKKTPGDLRRARSMATVRGKKGGGLKKKIRVDMSGVGKRRKGPKPIARRRRKKKDSDDSGSDSDDTMRIAGSDDSDDPDSDSDDMVTVRPASEKETFVPEWKQAQMEEEEAQRKANATAAAAENANQKKGFFSKLSCMDVVTIMWYFFVVVNILVGIGAIVLLVFDVLNPPLVNYYFWAPMFGVSGLVVLLAVIIWLVQIVQKCREYDILNLEKLKMLGQVDKHDIEMLKMRKAVEQEEEKTLPDIEMDMTIFKLDMDDVRLDRELGRGGSDSIIYLALFKGKEVGVKMFKTVSFKEQVDYDEFEREVKIMSQCTHPNLLKIYGAAFKPPRVCIVMEFCENGDIMDYLYKTAHGDKPVLTVREKVRILSQIVEGMLYLHDKNIMHRDLKTLNVLLTQDMTAKIIDFGLSKRADRGTGRHTKAIGTAVYMAPELTLGKDYGPKVDVFAFGIMMFELLTEKYEIYEGGSPRLAIEVSVARDPTFRPKIGLTEYGKELKWFVRLMKKCWDHDPEVRPTFKKVKLVFDANWEKVRGSVLQDEPEERTGRSFRDKKKKAAADSPAASRIRKKHKKPLGGSLVPGDLKRRKKKRSDELDAAASLPIGAGRKKKRKKPKPEPEPEPEPSSSSDASSSSSDSDTMVLGGSDDSD